jgi:gliding motility-associated protein GldM
MYLVLTALLALNVSKEILNAFVLVNDGLELTTKNFGEKNALTYKAFEKAKANNAAKVEKFYNKAQLAKQYSKELDKYIEELKVEIIMEADKLTKSQADTTKLENVNSKDNQEIPGHIMIGGTEDGANGKARELKKKLDDYKSKLTGMFKDIPGGDKITFGPDTKDPKPSIEHGKQSWEMHYFDHTPLAAVITLLSKLQADVKNSEAEAINNLLKAVDMGDFKFDTLVAEVVAPSSYVLVGNEYKADIFVAAFSSTQDPEITVGGSLIKVEGGMGKYSVHPTKEGINKWGGSIKVKGPTGEIKEYPFEQEYMAAKPSTVISATKMNLLYVGIPNPISISCPGISTDKIRATISQGTLVPDPKLGSGNFLANVKPGSKAVISVSAEIDKKVTQLGTAEYRVKLIPDPKAKIAGKTGGPINKAILAAQNGVIPVLEDFEFEGVNYTIKSFSFTRAGKGRDPLDLVSNSVNITSEMKAGITNSRIGDKIYFENIKAVGPDGTLRSLSSVNFVIQ